MKRLLFLLLFSMLLLPFTLAQMPFEIQYCKASLAKFSQSDLEGLGISQTQISEARDCVCYKAEPQFSDWLLSESYCEDNKMKQKRDVHNLIPPLCANYEKTIETRFINDDRCLGLPEPKILSEWGTIGCYSTGKVEVRHIVAYFFSDDPTEGPKQKRELELQTVDAPCNFFTDVLNSPEFWINGIGFFFILLAILLVVLNRKTILRGIK